MTTRDSPPNSPNPVLKRAYSLPIYQLAWREMRRGPPAICLEQLKVPVSHDLAPGELLVEVKAAALNPVGYKLMQMLPNTIAKRPHTAESDFTGTVVAQQGVTGFKEGEEVCGWISQPMSQITSQGALCQYVRVRSDHVFHKPSNISIPQAAGICLAGLSAWLLLFENAHIKEGHHILINNSTGGVGTFAVQIAKAYGCHVTATASSRNHEFVRQLGADAVLDYKDLVQTLLKNPPAPAFDSIIDCYGLDSELYTQCEHFLKPEGVFCSVAPAAGTLLDTAKAASSLFSKTWRPRWLGGNPRRFSLLNLENSKEALRKLESLITEGKVVPIIDSVFKFDDVLMAYEQLMSKRARGKVIVAIDSEIYLQYRQQS